MKLFIFALFALFAVSSFALDEHQEKLLSFNADNFQEWKEYFGIEFNTIEEHEYRYSVYLKNLEWAAELNANEEHAQFGATKFAHLTRDEFKKYYTNNNGDKYMVPELKQTERPTLRTFDWGSNQTVNWATAGATTPVKDQEQCGSCWAFSATEQVESDSYMQGKNPTPPVLAPQQIVSCDTAGQDQGCNGGFTEGAFTYVESAGGMMAEKDYPYTGRDGQCKFDASKVVAGTAVTGYSYVVPKATVFTTKSACTGGSGFQAALQASPVSICVDAEPWQVYITGVLSSNGCSSGLLSQDHCVQAVGYNFAADKPYWYVRNSWNTNWGEKGYILLEAGSDGSVNTCGLCNDATVVTLK